MKKAEILKQISVSGIVIGSLLLLWSLFRTYFIFTDSGGSLGRANLDFVIEGCLGCVLLGAGLVLWFRLRRKAAGRPQ